MTVLPLVYWTGQQVVVEWLLRALDGTPVDGATVTGQVGTPGGLTAPMTVTSASGGVYRAAHVAAEPGTHTYALTAAGTFQDAVQGTFMVGRDVLALPPITVDPASDIGMIRLLITDVDETAPLFEDAQLTALLTMEGGVKRAAAAALETIARSEALVSKKIRTQDLSTDGPAVAAELRASAKALREQAQKDDDDLTTGDAAWAISVADFDPNAAYRWW